ncbi:MAG: VanZ family protein [Butyrivibrio sp.]|nr:VanZ family protein [Butyrivibrio sp.]
MIIEFIRENADVFQKILRDIHYVSGYAYAGIAIATVYVAVYLLYVLICKLLKKERRLGTDHAIAMCMLLIYMTSLLYIVFMSRELGEYEYYGVNLQLWSSWGTTVTKRAFFIENILLFIPMGILMPSAFTKFRKIYICIPCCFLFSFFIETIQYAFGLGIAELDDLITNTFGALIGLIVWYILYLIHLVYHRFLKRK